MYKKILGLLALLAVLLISGCAGPPPGGGPQADQRKIADLTEAIIGLGPEVDRQEAARAARISVMYPRQLAIEYQITDPPLIHNIKVNNGTRPRGLCWQWAEDMEKRLRRENFKTLDLFRAIANSDALFRIDHSTVIVSRRTDTMYQGLVLDPWRWGGTLYWGPVLADKSYPWRPQAEVLEEIRARQLRKAQRAG